MRRVIALSVVAMMLFSGTAVAVDYSGSYKGHKLSLALAAEDDSYTGTIQMSTGETLPLRVRRSNGKLIGTFTADGESFDVVITLSGNTLSLTTDGTTHILTRQAGDGGGAKNPLERRPRGPRATVAGKPAMRFAKFSVTDPGINNIECISMLIPVGWKTEGGVQWFPDYSILANLLLRVTDPQTGACIEFLPMQNFTWIDRPVVPMQPGQNYLGSIVCQPIQDLHQFVQTMYAPQAMRHLQNAHPIAAEEFPKVAQQVAQSYGGQSQVKAGRVRYEYQINGQNWEEDVYLTLVYTPWQMGTMWSVYSAYSFRAPAGELDRLTPLMNTSIRTMRLNLDWYAGYMYVQKLFNDRMMGGIRDAKAISDTITRNSEEIRRMFADSYRQANESQDRISASFSEYIRGVDTYRNPFEDRPIQLPSGYRDAWVNARGEYLLSNDAGYNPNVGDTMEWRRMDRRGD